VSGVATCYREYKLTFGKTTKFGNLTFGEVTFGKMTTVGKITFGELTFSEIAFGDLTFVEMISKTSNASVQTLYYTMLLLCH